MLAEQPSAHLEAWGLSKACFERPRSRLAFTTHIQNAIVMQPTVSTPRISRNNDPRTSGDIKDLPKSITNLNLYGCRGLEGR